MQILLAPTQGVANAVWASSQASARMLGLPFDAARQSYACAVRSGLIERSLIGWARFERELSALETLTLGPLARHV